jgi:hypothetical protein
MQARSIWLVGTVQLCCFWALGHIGAVRMYLMAPSANFESRRFRRRFFSIASKAFRFITEKRLSK